MPTHAWLDKMQREDPSNALLLLLTITHPAMEAPLRFVNDKMPITSRGHGYVPFPIRFQRPGHGEDGPTMARCTVDNVSQEMSQLLLSLPSSPTLVFELVLQGNPDGVEEPFPPFKMMNVTGNRFDISAPLQDVDDDSEPLMMHLFTPKTAPALFS